MEDASEEAVVETDVATTTESTTESERAPPAESDSAGEAPALGTLASPTRTDPTIHARVFAQPLGTNGSIGSDDNYTVGTTFRRHTYTTLAAGPQAPVTDGWATCTIESGGSGTIKVPATNPGAANNGARFWVVQEPLDIPTPHGPLCQSDRLLLGSSSGPALTRHIVGATNQLVPNTVQDLS